MFCVNRAATAQHQGALHDVGQFTHIARPAVTSQQLLGLFGHCRHNIVGSMCLQHLACQRQHITGTLGQGWNTQTEGADTEVQIFTEFTCGDGGTQILVGGGDQAEIHRDRALRTDTGDLLFLNHAQQLGLKANRHLADFVQEQRATNGLFKHASMLTLGAGESTFFMTE